MMSADNIKAETKYFVTVSLLLKEDVDSASSHVHTSSTSSVWTKAIRNRCKLQKIGFSLIQLYRIAQLYQTQIAHAIPQSRTAARPSLLFINS